MFSGGAREISIAVRDGLLLLEQQQATTPATLIEELEQEAAASLRAVQNLVDGMSRQRRLYLANGMRQAVEAGIVPPGGTYSLARWREIQEAFDEFEKWLQAPMVVCGLPPLVVVSRRGNPPEVAQPEPEPAPVEPTEEPAP